MWGVADRRYFLLLMGGLIILAWLTLWLWGQSPYGRLLNHDELSGADLSHGLVVLVIVVCWPSRRCIWSHRAQLWATKANVAGSTHMGFGASAI
jgi:hypothetical protein